jgi:GNAT superfamily N-acetyltransferase
MKTIRPVRSGDLAVICVHRRRMFLEMGTEQSKLDVASDSFAIWLAPLLESGDYFGFLVEDAEAVVAGIGVNILDFPPGPLHPESNRRGLISNVYVNPEYRGQGIARELMGLANAELRRRGVTYAVLQASAMGRPMYEKLGWAFTAEMGKALA